MQLKIAASHDGQTLQVRYALTNDSRADVFVQHFVVQHPEPRPSCYIYHLRPDQVVLWAGSPPIPPLIFMGQPPTALAERLPRGDSLDVVLRLPLPLVERGVWGPRGGTLEPVSASVIRFRLDLQPKRRGLSIVEPEPGVYLVRGKDPEILEATTTVAPSFVVHRREDNFHRGGFEPTDPHKTPF